MKWKPMYILVFIFLLTGMILSQCDNEANKGADESKLKIIDSDTKTSENLKIVYYKDWNEKKNKPYGRVSDSERKKLNSYFEVGYNKKKQIEKVVGYQEQRPIITLYHSYSDRGHISKRVLISKSANIWKILQVRRAIIDIKVVSHFNPLGQETSETTYTLGANRWNKQLVKKFAENRQVSRLDQFDDDEKLMQYTLFKYKGNKLVTKTAYNRDIKLRDSDEYTKQLYLDYIEQYGPDGKVLTKKFFYKDDNPNKLWWTDRYSYIGTNTQILSYEKEKLIKKRVLNKDGKVISSKIYDFQINN